jgi:hypothetical protein
MGSLRTPFGCGPTSRVSLLALCTCCAFWGDSLIARAAPAEVTATTVTPTPAPAARGSPQNNASARAGRGSFDKRVLVLVVLAGSVGMIVGWSNRGRREIRFRLLNKPNKAPLPVLVPPRPTARLVPGDLPNATRALRTRAPIPQPIHTGGSRSRVIHYLAVFAESAQPSSQTPIDFLLVEGDGVEDAVPEQGDPPTSSA